MLQPSPRVQHVILDRDGVLNLPPEDGFVKKPNEFVWIPAALTALAVFAKLGIRVSVVTNQSCVGRGLISLETMLGILDEMRTQAQRAGGWISLVLACPHAPDADCACRKPKPGLVERAIRDSGLPRAATLLVGDSLRDLQAAQAAQVVGWLVRTGKGTATETLVSAGPVDGLSGAAVPVFDDLLAIAVSMARRAPPTGQRTLADVVAEHRGALDALEAAVADDFQRASDMCFEALCRGNKLLICGNGGSAADSQHFAAELVGRFEHDRPALPAIALTTDSSILSAVGNDLGYERVFLRQVEALGRPGDVLVCLSTSGNSANVVLAATSARRIGINVIGLTGASRGRLGPLTDVCLAMPSERVARIQELHEICLHALAELLEGVAGPDVG